MSVPDLGFTGLCAALATGLHWQLIYRCAKCAALGNSLTVQWSSLTVRLCEACKGLCMAVAVQVYIPIPLPSLDKPSTTIDHSALVERHFDLDLNLWPWPWGKLKALKMRCQNTINHRLTYDLDLQSQPSQGQGRPSCQKSRSKVKWFKQESANS